ncbi:MAG: hypothetical protein MUC74_09905 [Ideonella sp.]|jgi:hypothetical protein|nr:hypothetical protein [Ideonella sp.]
MDPVPALLVVLSIAVAVQAAAILALRRRVERAQVENRHHLDEAIEEVRALARRVASRAPVDSRPDPLERTTVPSALPGEAFSKPLPLESQTPAERRLATAPKSVVKAAIEFSNPAFDAFARPPTAFADTQALDPGEAESELQRARR